MQLTVTAVYRDTCCTTTTLAQQNELEGVQFVVGQVVMVISGVYLGCVRVARERSYVSFLSLDHLASSHGDLILNKVTMNNNRF